MNTENISETRKVLNVGGMRKDIPLPPAYAGWTSVLLDIDPTHEPDLLMDVRYLGAMPQLWDSFDAVYASHIIEHLHRHEALDVLKGFLLCLHPGGTVEIHTPDIGMLVRRMMALQIDLEDFLYESPAGDIRPIDMLYGFQPAIEYNRNDWMAHKYGYSVRTLGLLLTEAGFEKVESEGHSLNIKATGRKP